MLGGSGNRGMSCRGTGPWRMQSWGEGGTVELSREDRGTVEAAVGTGEWLETGIQTGAGGYASTGRRLRENTR